VYHSYALHAVSVRFELIEQLEDEALRFVNLRGRAADVALTLTRPAHLVVILHACVHTA
jgi:hypothetical protein